MKKLFSILIVVIAIVSCSSDPSENSQDESKNSQNITTSDIKGKWKVISDNLKGVRLILDDNSPCVWSDKFSNTFSGPYYFIENVSDDVLKNQCALIGSDVNDKIHISVIKVQGHTSGNADLYIRCDLMPLLPNLDWQYFSEKVNREAWYFWEGNWFYYTFEVTNYTDNYMHLKLRESSIRFDDYEQNYPLRIDAGTVIMLQREQ